MDTIFNIIYITLIITAGVLLAVSILNRDLLGIVINLMTVAVCVRSIRA